MEEAMREAWKGMIIGAVMGAAVGLALEGFRLLSQGARRAADEVGAQAPGVAQGVADFVDRTSQKVRESDLADHAAEKAQRASERVKAAAGSGRDALSESR